MDRLEAASKAKDYGAVKECYAADAVIEIHTKTRKRRFLLDDYISMLSKSAVKVGDYTFDAQDTKIAIEDDRAQVRQTVTETARPKDALLRSKTEAAYTVRLVDGKPRIIRVTAKLIVAVPGTPEDRGTR